MDSTAAVPWLKLWLAEQGLGARDSILGFANSVSEIEYILLPSRKMTETFFKQYMTKNQRQPKQNSSARRGQGKMCSKLLPGDSKTVPFLSISASCPLLFYEKGSHFKGIQPKLGSRFVYIFLSLSAIARSPTKCMSASLNLGAYLDVRANRVTIKYERGLWERLGVWKGIRVTMLFDLLTCIMHCYYIQCMIIQCLIFLLQFQFDFITFHFFFLQSCFRAFDICPSSMQDFHCAMRYAILRSTIIHTPSCHYCSPDDRAALYIQVYTQTREILTGEVV